ncbi:MAG: hypothetical protein V1763_00135 [Parcubacteria group bacterium]
MPIEVKLVWQSDRGGDIQEEIATKLGIGNQVALVTILVNDLYFKRVPIADIEKEVKARFELPAEKVKPLAIEILGRRCLIIDNEWFGGEVARKIAELGGDSQSFAESVKAFQDAVDAENAPTEEELASQQLPLAITDPEKEKQSAKTVFNSQIKEILSGANADVKMELNSRLFLLLATDTTQQFQHDLVDVLQSNNETLTPGTIILHEDKVDATVSNWLKDYIHFAGADAVGSSIKKAQYFTEGSNIKKLSALEKSLVQDLIDLYANLRNFYLNVTRIEHEEVQIFPLTEAELFDYLKKERASSSAEASEDKDTTVDNARPVDIASLYADKPADRVAIDKEKQNLIAKTRKEYNKVADSLDEYLLNRKKIGSLACLEILAETGSLDNVLENDSRFRKMMLNYFKRNNLTQEAETFKKDPFQSQFVEYFLKSILLERLGLPEREGARIASRLSNIFRDHGQPRYGRLAYLDMKDNSFKWT